MTEKQRVAIDYLSKYKEAKRNIEIQKQKIEIIETRCAKQTKDPSSIMKGKWTPDGKVIAVPVVIQSSPCGNSAEDLLIQLMDMRSEYWQKCIAAEKLCMDIERSIAVNCSGIYSRILSMYYLYSQTLEQMAVSENFSYPHIKRLKWRALEMFGEKMSHNEP